jgi:hypothetical protein
MNYLYDYWIYEDVGGKENLIAQYQSNAVPPAVGTVLDLSEFVTTSHGVLFFGEVTKLRMAPVFLEEDHLKTSDQTLINVFLVSTVRENGEIIHADPIVPR